MSTITDGLTDAQVLQNRLQYGENVFPDKESHVLYYLLKKTLTEPMFILLVVACVLYMVLGQYSEGLIMLAAMLFVTSISFFQERRNSKALSTIKKMNQPKVKVIRNGVIHIITSEELVVGDILLLEEGEQVSADGMLLDAHDFSVDESILTGESIAVEKSPYSKEPTVYFGTTVQTGKATIRVMKVGLETRMGKLAQSIEQVEPTSGRFQKEIQSLVKTMAKVGISAFFLVLVVYYIRTGHWAHAIIFALTMAMSLLPEEIPVAFSTFLALGSRKLLKEQVLVKDPQVLETLGSTTVICIDKTGTITENRMRVDKVFEWTNSLMIVPSKSRTLTYAMWASEPQPYDPMEKAIHQAYMETSLPDDRNNYTMVHEYPLSGKPPAMTHIYENQEGHRIVACKGGPETIIQFCKLDQEQSRYLLKTASVMAAQGYRVLGVASATHDKKDPYPPEQRDFEWQCEGLIGLYDPPKSNIKDVISDFYRANIDVKILSGDYPETNLAVANKIALRKSSTILTGAEVMNMTDEALKNSIPHTTIFARMFPEAKAKVVKALRANDEVVVMIGDGVNDGLAIKAADVGVAMGSKGTEIAKQAASVVLLDNDLSHLFNGIINGRKITINLKKAIRYIFSIHIPIVLLVALPLLLDWPFVAIFLPVHVIFLELIMGPTCSVVYENEPIEKSMYTVQSQQVYARFLSHKELLLSSIQGLVIGGITLCLYYYLMVSGVAEMNIRAMVFATIVFANIFLTLENRSFTESLFHTLKYKNPGMYLTAGLSILLLAGTLYITPVRHLFEMETLSLYQLIVCLALGGGSVLWMEIYKLVKR